MTTCFDFTEYRIKARDSHVLAAVVTTALNDSPHTCMPANELDSSSLRFCVRVFAVAYVHS
jgi:hypothetical protein